MCGILGWLGSSINPEQALNMLNKLRHRGPDDAGYWFESDASVWLGHRRLAILDLSSHGHQPMHSSCGRYVIVYNGEVYNYRKLRNDLIKKGCEFTGESDTEVVLAACVVWGVEFAVKRFEGMFALAIYDRAEHCLWLARDPMGIKPLYYAHAGVHFAFSSELEPLLELSWIDKSIDQDSLYAYFRYRCVPSPGSIINGIRKLPSASVLKFQNDELKISAYWSLPAIVQNDTVRENLSMQEATDQLESLLSDSVAMHMQADVPYGAFLSGGVDSSTVVALMQEHSNKPINTFSIGFLEGSHNESDYAREIADHLGTNHHELILRAGDIPDLVTTVAGYYDEPFADSSSIPTSLVSSFAREKVIVSLSGDGGDELFGGYPRYFWAKRIESIKHRLTPLGCSIVSSMLHNLPDSFWDRVIDPMTRHRFSSSDGLSYRIHRMADYLSSDRISVYGRSMSVWKEPHDILGYKQKQFLGADARGYPELSWADEMMLIDQQCYLQDEILTKVDRASMAHSLEVRVPLLTHPIAEWSWKIENSLKFAERGDRGKLVLREVLYRHVPKELIERPKQGFGMPMAKWLRGPLKEWASSLLNQSTLEQCGLNVERVHQVWNEHQKGADHQAKIWTVLMYSHWYQRTFSI